MSRNAAMAQNTLRLAGPALGVFAFFRWALEVYAESEARCAGWEDASDGILCRCGHVS